jgi:CheY-like chemotaxis protein
LRPQLAAAWPELQVVAEARNGREALEQCERSSPTICFLDVHMPGLSGIEVAQRIGPRTHLVFVTAFDQYALKAFEAWRARLPGQAGQPARLAETVAAPEGAPAPRTAGAARERCCPVGGALQRPAASPLRWIRASVGPAVRTDPGRRHRLPEVDEKYTLVAWRGDGGKPAEALIRTPLKELLAQLDPAAVPAGAPLGGGQSARHPRRDTRAQRDGRHPAQAGRTSACR